MIIGLILRILLLLLLFICVAPGLPWCFSKFLGACVEREGVGGGGAGEVNRYLLENNMPFYLYFMCG